MKDNAPKSNLLLEKEYLLKLTFNK